MQPCLTLTHCNLSLVSFTIPTLPQEEEEEGIELDGADDATFGDMEDWEPPAEDAVAAGRAAYLQQRAQQKAAVALFNAQVAAHAAAQAQQ
jgi:hypothetical protein